MRCELKIEANYYVPKEGTFSFELDRASATQVILTLEDGHQVVFTQILREDGNPTGYWRAINNYHPEVVDLKLTNGPKSWAMWGPDATPTVFLSTMNLNVIINQKQDQEEQR